MQANKLNTANVLADAWDPDDGSTTFGPVKLSANGLEPVEWYACSTPATETMRDGITTALGALAWAKMYWADDVQADVPHWEGPDGWEFDGGIYSAWLDALDDMGLQRIQDPFALTRTAAIAYNVKVKILRGWARFKAWLKSLWEKVREMFRRETVHETDG